MGPGCEKMEASCSYIDISGNYAEDCIDGDMLWFHDNFNTKHERLCGNTTMDRCVDMCLDM